MTEAPVVPAEFHSMSRRRKLALAMLAWGVLFAFAEVGVRVWMAFRSESPAQMRYQYDWRRNKRLQHVWAYQDREYPYLPYVPRTKPPDVEMPGLRLTSPEETKPPDVFRIFCLGGSTTFLGYPAKLEAELRPDFAARGLRLEMVNAADLSWTSLDSLVNFIVRCLPYEPDAAIVYQAQNDAWPAFGRTYRPDYTHWRKRLVENTPMLSDYVPRILDYSAVYLQLRGLYESRASTHRWIDAMMHYIPDFDRDPYHGVAQYGKNIRDLIAIAQAHEIPLLLSTEVVNEDSSEKRLVSAVHEINDITRSFSDQYEDVTVVDAAGAIPGDDVLMRDICHFRLDGVGEGMLVRFLAEAVRANADAWVAARRTIAEHPRGRASAVAVVEPRSLGTASTGPAEAVTRRDAQVPGQVTLGKHR